DRVMIYRFDEKWNGEVIAESVRTKLESFKHLKYPASDIPPQARALFGENLSRIISNVSEVPVPILSRDLSPSQINLGPSILRAVSPIHLQYLENMGVKATFSVPIRVHERLWGLIACHHYVAPTTPHRNVRSAFELAAQILGGKISEVIEMRRLANKNTTLLLTQSLLTNVTSGKDLLGAFRASGDELLKTNLSTTVFIKIGDQHLTIGRPLDPQTIVNIQSFLANKTSSVVWSSHSLKDDLGWEKTDPNAAGALAIPFSLGFQDLLIWFRPEESQEVRWGGQPKFLQAPAKTSLERLTPRASFDEWVQITKDQCSPWTDNDLECAQYLLFGFVKEIFSRAQALSIAFSELEKVAQLKDEFISTVSHELRTPLGVIIGWVEILRDHPQENSEARQAIEIIERNSKLQVALIDDLLDVSRIISGKMRIQIRPDVDVCSIVSNIVESCLPTAKSKGLRVEWSPNGNILMSCDPERLRQIIWNLMSNSMKFTQKGGYVRVKVERRGSAILIEVEDNGVGIDDKNLRSIFDRFVQANAAAVRAGGLGLGLSIVKGLAELHGGRVEAFSSGRDQGSKFVVSLPVLTQWESAALPLPAAMPIEKTKQLEGLHVLIVEDQPEFLLALKILFERNGARVKTATQGIEALGLLKQEKFDLILSDLGMPEMDGLNLLIEWRNEEERRHLTPIPAIALTAYASAKDRTDALNAGFMSHLSKPVDRGELLAVIGSLMKSKKKS
ncbi:MAG: response regulator, partial [Bdellovibrionaceae bacterium]|nr:response regulator [Pseudobdellovibrionaceae bacterium]